MTNSVSKANKTKKPVKATKKTTTSKKTKAKTKVKTTHKIKQHKLDPALRQKMITETAYYRAQQRNFTPGQAINDWLLAEIEIDKILIKQ